MKVICFDAEVLGCEGLLLGGDMYTLRGTRLRRIRVRSVRFAPTGLEIKIRTNYVIFRSEVTWACGLVFEEAWCARKAFRSTPMFVVSARTNKERRRNTTDTRPFGQGG